MEKKSEIVLIQLKITRHESPFSLNPILPILGFSIRLDVNPGEKKEKPLTKTSNSSLKQILRHDEFFNCSKVERNTKGPKEVEEKKKKRRESIFLSTIITLVMPQFSRKLQCKFVICMTNVSFKRTDGSNYMDDF